MRHFSAVALSLCAAIMTFAAQHYLFPARLHAAGLVVPDSSDWRQQMIDKDPGGAVIDQSLDRLASRLDLSDEQSSKVRPLLENRHERILALLLTSPASLSRADFMAKRQAIIEQTHREIDALLTPEQRAIEAMRPQARR